AVLLRWLLDPLMGDTLPLVTLFGAIAVTVWFGGYRPALLAATIGYVACAYLFVEPRGSLGLGEVRNLVGFFAYIATCGIIIGFGEAMPVSRRRFEELVRQHVPSSAAARFLASIVESTGDAIISKSLDGTIQSWNAAAHRLFGYAADQAVGNHISLIIPPDRAG